MNTNLGVAGWPLLQALSLLPILSIQVPQFLALPPKGNPFSVTPIWTKTDKCQLVDVK